MILAQRDGTEYRLHAASFTSYVRPTSGSSDLLAWRLEIPAGVPGTPHRPNKEEVLLVLAGTGLVRIDGVSTEISIGSVVLVPAGAELCIDTGAEPLVAWVTTSVGLKAVTSDGNVITPPWAR